MKSFDSSLESTSTKDVCGGSSQTVLRSSVRKKSELKVTKESNERSGCISSRESYIQNNGQLKVTAIEGSTTQKASMSKSILENGDLNNSSLTGLKRDTSRTSANTLIDPSSEKENLSTNGSLYEAISDDESSLLQLGDEDISNGSCKSATTSEKQPVNDSEGKKWETTGKDTRNNAETLGRPDFSSSTPVGKVPTSQHLRDCHSDEEVENKNSKQLTRSSQKISSSKNENISQKAILTETCSDALQEPVASANRSSNIPTSLEVRTRSSTEYVNSGKPETSCNTKDESGIVHSNILSNHSNSSSFTWKDANFAMNFEKFDVKCDNVLLEADDIEGEEEPHNKEEEEPTRTSDFRILRAADFGNEGSTSSSAIEKDDELHLSENLVGVGLHRLHRTQNVEEHSHETAHGGTALLRSDCKEIEKSYNTRIKDAPCIGTDLLEINRTSLKRKERDISLVVASNGNVSTFLKRAASPSSIEVKDGVISIAVNVDELGEVSQLSNFAKSDNLEDSSITHLPKHVVSKEGNKSQVSSRIAKDTPSKRRLRHQSVTDKPDATLGSIERLDKSMEIPATKAMNKSSKLAVSAVLHLEHGPTSHGIFNAADKRSMVVSPEILQKEEVSVPLETRDESPKEILKDADSCCTRTNESLSTCELSHESDSQKHTVVKAVSAVTNKIDPFLDGPIKVADVDSHSHMTTRSDRETSSPVPANPVLRECISVLSSEATTAENVNREINMPDAKIEGRQANLSLKVKAIKKLDRLHLPTERKEEALLSAKDVKGRIRIACGSGLENNPPTNLTAGAETAVELLSEKSEEAIQPPHRKIRSLSDRLKPKRSQIPKVKFKMGEVAECSDINMREVNEPNNKLKENGIGEQAVELSDRLKKVKALPSLTNVKVADAIKSIHNCSLGESGPLPEDASPTETDQFTVDKMTEKGDIVTCPGVKSLETVALEQETKSRMDALDTISSCANVQVSEVASLPKTVESGEATSYHDDLLPNKIIVPAKVTEAEGTVVLSTQLKMGKEATAFEDLKAGVSLDLPEENPPYKINVKDIRVTKCRRQIRNDLKTGNKGQKSTSPRGNEKNFRRISTKCGNKDSSLNTVQETDKTDFSLIKARDRGFPKISLKHLYSKKTNSSKTVSNSNEKIKNTPSKARKGKAAAASEDISRATVNHHKLDQQSTEGSRGSGEDVSDTRRKTGTKSSSAGKDMKDAPSKRIRTTLQNEVEGRSGSGEERQRRKRASLDEDKLATVNKRTKGAKNSGVDSSRSSNDGNTKTKKESASEAKGAIRDCNDSLRNADAVPNSKRRSEGHVGLIEVKKVRIMPEVERQLKEKKKVEHKNGSEPNSSDQTIEQVVSLSATMCSSTEDSSLDAKSEVTDAVDSTKDNRYQQHLKNDSINSENQRERAENDSAKETVKENCIQEDPKKYNPMPFMRQLHRSELRNLTRNDLEELVVQKLCEIVTERCNVGELRRRAQLLEQMLEQWRKKAQLLGKQVKDMEMVMKRFTSDQKQKKDRIALPVKLTRSVGLQVHMGQANNASLSRTRTINEGNRHPLRRRQERTSSPAVAASVVSSPKATPPPSVANQKVISATLQKAVNMNNSLPSPMPTSTIARQGPTTYTSTQAVGIKPGQTSIKTVANRSPTVSSSAGTIANNTSPSTRLQVSPAVMNRTPKGIYTATVPKPSQDLIDLTDEEDRMKTGMRNTVTSNTSALVPPTAIVTAPHSSNIAPNTAATSIAGRGIRVVQSHQLTGTSTAAIFSPTGTTTAPGQRYAYLVPTSTVPFQQRQVLIASAQSQVRGGGVMTMANRQNQLPTLLIKGGTVVPTALSPVTQGSVPPGACVPANSTTILRPMQALPSPLQTVLAPAQRSGQIRVSGSNMLAPVGRMAPVTNLAPSQPPIPSHPAPLPGLPAYATNNLNLKLAPPKPELKISKVPTKNQQGIVLSWNMHLSPDHEEVASYQLYAYQEGTAPPSTSLWKKVGDVKALPLPMACTLTQFQEGHKYHFAVRAVDVHMRCGQFSTPGNIILTHK